MKGGMFMSNTKQTSASVASKASTILRDGRYSKTSKAIPHKPLKIRKKNGII